MLLTMVTSLPLTVAVMPSTVPLTDALPLGEKTTLSV